MLIKIYSKNDCPYCQKAKAFLQSNTLPYDETVLDRMEDRQALYDRLGLEGPKRTVPQIFLHETDGTTTRIGGYDDLVASDILARWQAGNFNEEF
jgi:glutaredoxin